MLKFASQVLSETGISLKNNTCSRFFYARLSILVTYTLTVIYLLSLLFSINYMEMTMEKVAVHSVTKVGE